MEKKNEPVYITPDEKADSYIPTENSIANDLNSLTERERECKIESFTGEVKKICSFLESRGIIKNLENVKDCHDEMENGAGESIDGVPNNKPKYYWWHINIEYASSTDGCLEATQLLRGTKLPGDFSTDAKKTANVLAQLQRLNTILSRIKVCYDISADTGIAFETVLTLYRVEGDMNYAPSLDAVYKGIPTGFTEVNSSLNPRPDLSTMIMLFSEEKYMDYKKSAVELY
ncbi:MAG: hypothetical protein JW915_11355 [Chitinispirillaceae bacterium]|nr:hypothetical protein [Chitinispirillaceae bacterium]